MAAKEHAVYIEEHGKLPLKKNKESVLDKVHDHINERDIWIPYDEFHSHVSVMIDRLNRKNPLFKPSAKKANPVKPKPPKAGIEDFPASVQIEIKEKMAKLIAEYILQTRRVPSDKTRSGHIKVILSGFNSKQWMSYEKRLIKNEALLNLYDVVREQSK